MRILIFSWRDIKNPKFGGAEILTHELAKRWVKKGHKVSLVATKFPKGKSQEEVDGVRIYRPAEFYQYSPLSYLPYLFKTARFYKKNLQGRYDIIIDQIHGLPLLTPFYTKEKVVLFPLEVAKDIWRYEVPFPFWPFGCLLEFIWLRFFKNYPFLTISDSTSRDLKRWGIKNVKIITPGINFKPLDKLPQKSSQPTIISLSRVTPMKRIEQTLEAFKRVTKKFPQAKLYIVGRGKVNYFNKLKRQTRQLNLEKKVIFTGFVSERKKQDLLSKAWLLVSTSLREGWGLNVIEAAACGTPTVVYKVPGLVDSVQDKKTGLICQTNSPEELAQNLVKLLTDKKLRNTLSENALNYSRGFSWEKAAKEGLKILQKIVS